MKINMKKISINKIKKNKITNKMMKQNKINIC